MNKYNEALEMIRTLQVNGYESFFIGGCVRDKLLGLEPKDYDIVTNAKPEEIQELFKDRKLSFVGEQFKVMIVDGIEIATYRGERYDKAGKPVCTYVKTLKEDCNRRDFTINAIAYNPMTDEYKDYHNGIIDLKNKLIRFIGIEEDRLKEDPIRAFRALRFAAVYNMELDYCSESAIEGYSYEEYEKIPKERIKIELDKVFKSKNFGKFFRIMPENMKAVFPIAFSEKILYEQFRTPLQRLSYLFVKNDDYIDGLIKMKYSNDEIKVVKSYIETSDFIDSNLNISEKIIELYNRQLSIYDWYDFNMEIYSGIPDKIKELALKLYIREHDIQAKCLKDLAINGTDIMEITTLEGDEIGKMLNKIFYMVINDKIKNDKDVLLKYLEENYG